MRTSGRLNRTLVEICAVEFGMLACPVSLDDGAKSQYQSDRESPMEPIYRARNYCITVDIVGSRGWIPAGCSSLSEDGQFMGEF